MYFNWNYIDTVLFFKAVSSVRFNVCRLKYDLFSYKNNEFQQNKHDIEMGWLVGYLFIYLFIMMTLVNKIQ